MDTFVLLVLLFLCGAASGEDPVVISVRPGENVILPCRSADPNIVVVQWTRPDLKPEYVFFSIDGRFISENQHPSFQGRVQLLHRDLKDGNASLILKNVSSSDEGTYECRVRVDDSRRKKRDIFDEQPIRRVRLQVTAMMDGDKEDGGKKDGDKKDGGHTFRSIGLAAAGVLVCLSVVGLFVLKSKRRLNNEPEAAADEAEKVVII